MNYEGRIVLFYILAKLFRRETYPDMSNTLGTGACVCVCTQSCVYILPYAVQSQGGVTFVWGTLGVEYS